MHSWRPTNSYPARTFPFFAWLAILIQGGCHSAPFYTATSPGEGDRSGASRKQVQTASGDSDWDGGRPSSNSEQKSQYHEVHAGESLPNLAKMYGLSVPQLLNANSLDASEELKVGQILKIPQPH